jgi:hypothetical protein
MSLPVLPRQRNQEARASVISPSRQGAFAAVLYSKEHGDLLISDAGKEIVAFNFTSRKTLYERK